MKPKLLDVDRVGIGIGGWLLHIDIDVLMAPLAERQSTAAARRANEATDGTTPVCSPTRASAHRALRKRCHWALASLADCLTG